jgi:predicted nuclease of restriction endonuclease-like RecB superfamily
MLTKDLLRYHIAGKRIKPDLIDTEDPRLLYFASRLISLYTESISLRRKELEELLKVESNSKRHQKLAKGLVKVLEGRST